MNRFVKVFDEHARKILSSGPYPLTIPQEGSVYDYFLDFNNGKLIKWKDRPGSEFKTLASSYTIVPEVRVNSIVCFATLDHFISKTNYYLLGFHRELQYAIVFIILTIRTASLLIPRSFFKRHFLCLFLFPPILRK